MGIAFVRGEKGEPMSRYIRLDDAIATIAGQMSYEIEAETGNETDCVDLAEELLNDIPSIDIVRCRECKYWNTDGCREGVGECTWAYYMTKPDDFCSYEERSSE